MKLVYWVIFGVVIISIALVFALKDDAKRKKASKEKKAREAEEKQRRIEEKQRQIEELKRKQDAEWQAEASRLAEWNSKHGRFTTALAGVTFDNEDGTSRQKILQDLKIRGTANAELNLEEYEYKGKPAIRVLVDDMCVGNIPKNRVEELLGIMDRLEKGSLEIETYRPDKDEDDPEERKRRGGTIYRADLFLIYRK